LLQHFLFALSRFLSALIFNNIAISEWEISYISRFGELIVSFFFGFAFDLNGQILSLDKLLGSSSLLSLYLLKHLHFIL
jgi:hypothetical protein